MILVEANSLENPLAEAWVRALRAAGLDAEGYCPDASVESGWFTDLNALPDDVSTVVFWWGIGAGRHAQLPVRFPAARFVLIVDTFPDASRLLTSAREQVFAKLYRREPDAIVTYSNFMTRDLQSRGIFRRTQDWYGLMQPFPLSMHSPGRSDHQVTGGPPSIIFTGRSDLLFGTATNMRKDALGPLFCRMMQEGLKIRVARPANAEAASSLERAGFLLYERLSPAQVANGSLARLVDRHDFQYCGYNLANRVIKRRVQNGLSSRFALGVTSMTPVIIEPEALSGRRWLEESDLPHVVRADGLAKDLKTFDNQRARIRWQEAHERWSAEGQRKELFRIFG